MWITFKIITDKGATLALDEITLHTGDIDMIYKRKDGAFFVVIDGSDFKISKEVYNQIRGIFDEENKES